MLRVVYFLHIHFNRSYAETISVFLSGGTMKKSFAAGLSLILFLTCFISSGHATLIAQYTFDHGTLADSSGSAVTYDLSAVGSSPDLSSGAYFSDGLPANYLQTNGPGGAPDWTLSLWVNTSVANQGQFKGLFSNNTSSTADFSFQIDSYDGQYRLVSVNLSTAKIIGTPTLDLWENIVVQKFGGNDARLYFNGQFIGTTGVNPGGLQMFRLGINRNSNNSFLGYLDAIQIWDDSLQNAAAIYAAGVGNNAFTAVPEPSTWILLGGGLIGLAAVRRRMR
jgi:hypothetical protein